MKLIKIAGDSGLKLCCLGAVTPSLRHTLTIFEATEFVNALTQDLGKRNAIMARLVAQSLCLYINPRQLLEAYDGEVVHYSNTRQPSLIFVFKDNFEPEGQV